MKPSPTCSPQERTPAATFRVSSTGFYLRSILDDAESLVQGQVSLDRISDELLDLEPL